ncbi:MAG: glycosyl hydrolase family 95 catalytic domain-containing protein [Muribaculaceae bacterium]
MRRNSTKISAALIAILSMVSSALAVTPPAEKLTLWYTQAADATSSSNQWMDYYLPIGNGQFGAMLSGGVSTDEIQYNEKTLWTGTIGQKAESSSSNVYGSYQNFGSLKVSTGHSSVSDYIRTLDLTTATGTVTYSVGGVEYNREYIASYPDKVIAVRYSASQSGQLNLTVTLSPGVSGSVSYANGEGGFSGKLDVVSYNSRFKVVNIGGTLSSSSSGITVSGADEVVIYLAGVTDFDNTQSTYVSGATSSDLANEVSTRLSSAASKGWQSVYSDHVNDYMSLFGRMSLDFINSGSQTKPTDELIDSHSSTSESLLLQQIYFAYGRYLAISSSRGISLPNNLQGIWNNSSSPSWNSDMHANINLQMNYWPVESTNLSEIHNPLLDWTITMSNSAEWKSYAQHACTGSTATSSNGWNLFTENSIFGGSGCWKHQNKVGNAWLCSHLWQHYLYSQDEAYLRKAFPTMLSATRYWLDILVESNGEYLCPAEYSPEHGPDNEDGVAYAQQLVAELFANTLAAVEVLGTSVIESTVLSDLQNKYSKLDKGMSTETYSNGYYHSPSHGVQSWPTSLNGITKNTVLLREWKTSNFYAGEMQHRHLSPLMCLYPFDQITDDNIKTAAQNLLTFRGDDSRGWSMGWKINLWARLKNATKAYTIIGNALKHCSVFTASGTNGGVYYNLLDAHPYFQIDGNFGFTAGIAEMLLQSQAGYLDILPVLPSDWASAGGSVKGMKGRGNFTIDFDWNTSGKVTKATIINVKGQPCKVSCANGAKGIAEAYVTVNGMTVVPTLVEGTTNVYAIASSADDEIVIDFVNSAPEVGTPIITAKAAEYDWSNVAIGGEYTATINVKGSDLNDAVTVASNNEMVTVAESISKTDAESGYALTATLKPTNEGEGSSTITFTSDGAEAKTVVLTWNAYDPASLVPSIGASADSYDWSEVYVGETYNTTVTVNAANLTGNVTVSSDNTELTPEVSTIGKDEANGYQLTVSLTPATKGAGNATLTFSTEGGESQTVTYSWITSKNSIFKIVIDKIKKFGTMITPFSASIPSGMQVYSITGVNGDFLTLSRETAIAAFLPYLVYAKNGIDTKIYGEIDESVTENIHTNGGLKGCAFNDETISMKLGCYVLQYKNSNMLFYDAEGVDFTIRKGKCWLDLSNITSMLSKSYRLDIGESGISAVGCDIDEDGETTVIYNLQGQRVDEMLPGNYYIVNGVKVYVR